MYYDEDDIEPYYNPEDFLEEYEVNLRDVITKAVNDKIKNTIEKLQLTEDENKRLSKEIGELKKGIFNSDRLHKEEMKTALKEKAKEVERKLGLGFAVNDVVWYIKNKNTQTTCEKCNGKYDQIEAEVLGKITKVRCPHCSYGKVNHNHYYPEKDTVRSLKFYISRSKEDEYTKNKEAELKETWDIDIFLDKYDSTMKRNSLYKTLEEAQAECDKKNMVEQQRAIKN